MEKGSGTRSGLLWEVERILGECEHKPQILVMENVTQVHGAGNEEHFREWMLRLEEMGYQNYWKDLSATEFKIPQTRNRTFMVSILGDYNYTFPKKTKLDLRLKDLLESEDTVDEKYYLSEKQIEDVKHWNAYEKPLETMEKIEKTNISPTLTTRTGAYAAGMILVKNATKKGYLEAHEGDGIDISSRMDSHRGTVQKGMAQTITTAGGENVGVVIKKNIPNENLKTKMCNDLINSGKVEEMDVIRHSYSTSRMNGEMKDLQQNNLSPTLDTRADCLGVVVKDNEEKKCINCKYYQYTNSSYFGGIPYCIKKNKDLIHELENDKIYFCENYEQKKKINSNLRIRKLTPKECFRLQGVKDEDIDLIMQNQSNSLGYHLAGDSICITVLMGIFSKLFDIDWLEHFNPEEWWKN